MRILILGICAMLTALVFAAMLVAIWKSRRSSDAATRFHHSAAADLAWAVIPCVMLVACAVPAVRLIVASAATVSQGESRESRAPAGWLPQQD
jgi:heme/copper-type cytochrome/quinol oxidase subunit 2